MENTRDITKECMQEDKTGLNKRIQILMSTYNGEKYLRDQLDSFVNLDNFEEVKVLIRDDGSTDSTLEILDEYRLKYGFEIIKGKNLGVNRSMTVLFKNSDGNCDYFALSDQDDVWLNNKLTKALDFLNKEDTSIPLLFGSCSEVVDEDMNHIGNTTVPNKGISFYNAISQNIIPGHTQVFNRNLMNMLIEIEVEYIHVIDWWIYLIATCFGKVTFINEFTVKHRQHGKNSVGYELNFFKKTLNRIKSLNKGNANSISKQLYSFYINYKENIKKEYLDEIDNFFIHQNNFFNRTKYMLSTKIYRQSYIETIIFKILYIFGKYNINYQDLRKR